MTKHRRCLEGRERAIISQINVVASRFKFSTGETTERRGRTQIMGLHDQNIFGITPEGRLCTVIINNKLHHSAKGFEAFYRDHSAVAVVVIVVGTSYSISLFFEVV